MISTRVSYKWVRTHFWSSPGASRKFRSVFTRAIFPISNWLFNANEHMSFVGVKVGVKVALGVKVGVTLAVGVGVGVQVGVAVGVGD